MFYCDQCGCCCRSIGDISSFQELNRGDGVCRYLNVDTNLCTIYENRPLLCRVEECYKMFFKDKISKEEYNRINYEACKILKKQFGE